MCFMRDVPGEEDTENYVTMVMMWQRTETEDLIVPYLLKGLQGTRFIAVDYIEHLPRGTPLRRDLRFVPKAG